MAVDQKLYVTKHAIGHPKDKNALKKHKAANDQRSKMNNTDFAIMKQFSVVSNVLIWFNFTPCLYINVQYHAEKLCDLDT